MRFSIAFRVLEILKVNFGSLVSFFIKLKVEYYNYSNKSWCNPCMYLHINSLRLEFIYYNLILSKFYIYQTKDYFIIFHNSTFTFISHLMYNFVSNFEQNNSDMTFVGSRLYSRIYRLLNTLSTYILSLYFIIKT